MKVDQAQTRANSINNTDATNAPNSRISTWVILGFFLWIGFFIGAVVLHAMVK